MNKGIWRALGAYVVWGLLPLYWKALHAVPALQVISHRIAWSAVLLAVILAVTRRWGAFLEGIRSRRTVATYAIAAALLGVNWLLYVWAVNAGFVVETSLGYFINPLLSVVLGIVFFRERLRPLQWASVGVAAVGVAYLTWDYGRPPWIALVLASTFALYGVVKKRAPLGSVDGLALETGLLFLPAVVVLGGAEVSGTGALAGATPLMWVALVATGAVTTVPLLLFASAAKRIPLALVGILQYVAPTLQFLLGVFVFREAVSPHTMLGFGMVWGAVVLFIADAVRSGMGVPVTAE